MKFFRRFLRRILMKRLERVEGDDAKYQKLLQMLETIIKVIEGQSVLEKLQLIFFLCCYC